MKLTTANLTESEKQAVLVAREIQAKIEALTAPTEDPKQRRQFNKLFKSRDALMPANLLYGTWVALVCRPDLCD